MQTAIASQLGIEFPIFAFSHCRDVVAAVSKAGGLGVLGAVGHTPELLDTELTWIEEHCGGKPFGVDLLLPPKYVGAEQGGIDAKQAAELLPEEHRAFVDDLLARYGVPAPADPPRSIGGLNISPKGYEPLLEVTFAHNIRLFASALGPPPADVVRRAHDKDVVVAALAGTTEHARRHAAAGVDLIVAQGTEAGGHTGEVATMVLVPEVVDAVAPVPVLVLLCLTVLLRSLERDPHRWPFVAALAIVFLGYTGMAISIWPHIVPPTITIWEAASPPASQGFALVGTLFILPIILMYTIWSYWVFRGKVKADAGYH